MRARIMCSAVLLLTCLGCASAQTSDHPQPPSGHQVYRGTEGSKGLPLSRTPPKTLEIHRMAELRGMLERREFESLTCALETYQDLFEKDHSNEYIVYDAFRSFRVTLPSYEPFLNEWVESFPERCPPHLACASYYYAQAWESRGTRFRKDTPEENFRGMRFYLQKAAEAAYVALELNPLCFAAYDILLGIYNTAGMSGEEEDLYHEAIARFPTSFLIRSTHMWALLPRWGGSYGDMEHVAKIAEQHAATNPQLSALYGFIYHDQGRVLEKREDYLEALEMYTRALAFGDHWAFYNERASLYYYDLKKDDLALEDVNRAILLRPTIAEPYRLRAKILFRQGDVRESIRDTLTADLLQPGDEKTRKWRVYAADTLRREAWHLSEENPEKAIETYSSALDFDPDNPDIYIARGLAWLRLNRIASAIADYEKALILGPRDLKTYGLIDNVLRHQQRWDAAVDLWNRYIQLEPDDPNALVRRGVVHLSNKDAESAKRDFERSCELGNPEACDRYKIMEWQSRYSPPEARP